MKQSFCFKNFLVIYISLITGVITIFSVNPAIAEPNCYMIDSNGNMMNLSSLCGSSKSNSRSPTSRLTPQPSNPIPDALSPDNDPNSPNAAKGDNNQNEASQADNTNEKKEVDRSELPPVQRAIPLINKQRNPEATEKP